MLQHHWSIGKVTVPKEFDVKEVWKKEKDRKK